MVYWTAIGCTNRWLTCAEKGKSYHQVTTEKKRFLLQQWIHTIHRIPPLLKDPSFHICSVNFKEASFEQGLKFCAVKLDFVYCKRYWFKRCSSVTINNLQHNNNDNNNSNDKNNDNNNNKNNNNSNNNNNNNNK